jgi:hypothetical protein
MKRQVQLLHDSSGRGFRSALPGTPILEPHPETKVVRTLYISATMMIELLDEFMISNNNQSEL